MSAQALMVNNRLFSSLRKLQLFRRCISPPYITDAANIMSQKKSFQDEGARARALYDYQAGKHITIPMIRMSEKFRSGIESQ